MFMVWLMRLFQSRRTFLNTYKNTPGNLEKWRETPSHNKPGHREAGCEIRHRRRTTTRPNLCVTNRRLVRERQAHLM